MNISTESRRVFLLFFFIALIIACSSTGVSAPKAPLPPLDIGPDAAVPGPHTTGAELVRDFRVGWNLGNTLDSYSGGSYTDGWIEKNTDRSPRAYETAWGNPVTNKEIFETVRAAGFGAVRIPVTWGPHMTAAGTVSAVWLDRVEELVQMALEAGLYCIVNSHHDTGSDSASWIKAGSVGSAAREAKFTGMWRCIADRFAGYDGRLLFEGFNEILDAKSSWEKSDADSLAVVNRLNQLFVDAVRASGGHNARRFLIVSTYAASGGQNALAAFQLPNDVVPDRLIVEVHDYSPMDFTWQQENVSWMKTRAHWGTGKDYVEHANRFDRLKKRFIDRDVPVILGEFCADNKDNLADRIRFAQASVRLARERGIACFWWDAGGECGPDTKHNRNYYSGGSLLDRRKLQWLFPELNDALVRAWGDAAAAERGKWRKLRKRTARCY
ncbi:MAG: glycoside hydrolase family 5 protein [Spirochaetales bacterium]|nr:glycoside hydrolase family 5 protein [Spirochaetales bacterium]